MEKIHKKSEVWHRHGKHKGRARIASMFDSIHQRPSSPQKMYGSAVEAVREESKQIGRR
jgi:hypothetical protein